MVRLTCPEPIVERLVASGLFDRFAARHPGLTIEFVTSDHYLDLRDGAADVALRSGDTDDGDLVGRRVADSLWAVYASRRYVAREGAPTDPAALANHALIGFDPSLAGHRAALWLRRVAPSARIVARSPSILGLLHCARAGIGIAALPTALGDAEADLVRLFGPIADLTRYWRLLTLPELRRTARVAALFDFIADEAEALRPVLTG